MMPDLVFKGTQRTEFASWPESTSTVGSNLLSLDTAQLLQHDQRRIALRRPVGLKHFCIHDQSVEALANTEGVKSIIGGGDTAAAVGHMPWASKFTHISTGGGATLEYLEGQVLPGVKALET